MLTNQPTSLYVPNKLTETLSDLVNCKFHVEYYHNHTVHYHCTYNISIFLSLKVQMFQKISLAPNG